MRRKGDEDNVCMCVPSQRRRVAVNAPNTQPEQNPDKWDILDMGLRVCVASQRLRVLLHRARSESL